jgi:hypothetical protein
MYNSFGELPGFTAVKQNGLHVGVEDSYFSVVENLNITDFFFLKVLPHIYVII